MDRDIFNYPESTEAPVKTKKSKTNRIVYSDRTGNQSYEDPYFQRKRSSHGIGTPYYIVGEKNGTYKLVQADPDITGKPKSIIGFLYNNPFFHRNLSSQQQKESNCAGNNSQSANLYEDQKNYLPRQRKL